MPRTSNTSPALMRLALAASALLVMAGLVAFWWASGVARKSPAKAAGQQVQVTIKDNLCQPNNITVPAGRTTFTIVNHSGRALEWEILDGVMVVEERENIAPGFNQTMTVNLQPGTYAITCGLLSNPRGTLRVTPSAASQAEAARPSLVAYVGPLAEYRVYLVLEAGNLQDSAQALADAIAAGDLAQARQAYARAHQSYLRIEPMADLFADLDTRLNARAEYYDKREADPGFSGFHRIQYGLYGPAPATQALAPLARQLQADIDLLATRLRTLDVPPQRLASAAARSLRRAADTLARDHADDSELYDLQGPLDGAGKIAELLSPLLGKSSPALQQRIQQALAASSSMLDPYRRDEGFAPTTLTPAQRQALARQLGVLADALGQANAALGLE